MTSEITKIGNLVFFQSYGPTLPDKIKTNMVQKFTSGPYVHVAVMIDNEIGIIEAGLNGITKSNLPNDPTQYTMTQTATLNIDANGKAHPLDKDRLAMAIRWAIEQIDTPYGFLDLLAQAADIVMPWNTLQLSATGRYDCSNFATMILDKAGVWLPESFKEPYNVNPNDLAEWSGLLPDRHRIKL